MDGAGGYWDWTYHQSLESQEEVETNLAMVNNRIAFVTYRMCGVRSFVHVCVRVCGGDSSDVGKRVVGL